MTDGEDPADVGGGSPRAQDRDGGSPEPADAADLRALREDVATLEATLEDLKSQLQRRSRRRLRPPGLGAMRRFTTEVSIPMTILVLETNVRALRILQRALEENSTSARTGAGETAGRVGRRAADVSGQALARLGDALADLQESVSPPADDDSLDGMLDEAARLQERVQSELERMEAGPETGTGASAADDGEESVAIDVDAELESIKSEIEDANGSDDG
jgi:hypothetical protein